MKSKIFIVIICTFLVNNFDASIQQTKGDFQDKFRQLEEFLPTPNDYRNAAGEPGKEYWQQKVDYKIEVELNESKRSLSAYQEITYKNNSPYRLKYLWVQLEQNRFKQDSVAERTLAFNTTAEGGSLLADSADDKPVQIGMAQLRRNQFFADNEIGYKISDVKDAEGEPLEYIINGSQMRIDLPTPIQSGETFKYSFEYSFNILEENAVRARSGYEHFPDDKRKGGNDIFLLAQWFPRVAAYSDYEAWHNKEFLGSGEFTLEFGDYDVEITVPEDHIVASTGELQNAKDVLTKTQLERLDKAKNTKRPVFIVTAEEALANEAKGTRKKKTWHFVAKNVRDFAWSSSRKFMWDAKGYEQGGDVQPLVMAMSYYPKEGGDLWKKYSTESVIHAMEVYSRYTFDYPYPVSISVNGPVGGFR